MQQATHPSHTFGDATWWQRNADANINANDYAMCYGVGGKLCSQAVEMPTWMLGHDDLGRPSMPLLVCFDMGITMDNAAAMEMLFGAPGDDNITGLLGNQR